MPTASELVTESFAQAANYASSAQGMLASFTSQLNAAVQNAPLVDVVFAPIPSPGAASPAVDAPVWTEPPEYTSTLLDAIGDAIASRMAGGTGLPADVEQGIWDRARERELATAQAKIDQATRDAESMGFALPPGVLAEQIRVEQRAYYDSVASLSRDIASKQADLEQSNLQKIFDQAVSFSSALADIRFKNSQVALDAFRGQIEGYRADISRFSAESEADAKFWEASIKQNEAIATYTLNGQKINSEIIRANSTALIEAAKTGAQVYAQLTASAYSLIHASASVGASSGMTVGYSYANDTSGTVPPVTSV